MRRTRGLLADAARFLGPEAVKQLRFYLADPTRERWQVVALYEVCPGTSLWVAVMRTSKPTEVAGVRTPALGQDCGPTCFGTRRLAVPDAVSVARALRWAQRQPRAAAPGPDPIFA